LLIVASPTCSKGCGHAPEIAGGDADPGVCDNDPGAGTALQCQDQLDAAAGLGEFCPVRPQDGSMAQRRATSTRPSSGRSKMSLNGPGRDRRLPIPAAKVQE
jgi:hypothetical protein